LILNIRKYKEAKTYITKQAIAKAINNNAGLADNAIINTIILIRPNNSATGTNKKLISLKTVS
jgi:hypothetical protein